MIQVMLEAAKIEAGAPCVLDEMPDPARSPTSARKTPPATAAVMPTAAEHFEAVIASADIGLTLHREASCISTFSLLPFTFPACR